jgi:TetR/AcrR family transcriptional regulator
VTASAPARLTSRAERTRTAILETAESLFAERGFDATRLEDVAERVGIRRASIVYYFKDKRELYEAVLHDLFSELLAGVEAALDKPGPLLARVDEAVAAWVETIGRRPSLPRLLLREVLDAGGETPVLRAHTEPFFALVRRALARSTDAELVSEIDQSHVTSAMAGASLFQLVALPALVPELGGDPLSPERLAHHREQLVRLAHRLLRAPRRAERK